MLDDIFPVGGVIESSEVGLELAAEDLESRALANTVGSDETEDIARPRHGQAMELEAVGRVTMRDLALEVGGKVDDGDGAEGAALGADTTTDAELLRDEGQSRRGGHLDLEGSERMRRQGSAWGRRRTQSLPDRTTGQDFLHSWRHFWDV